jgi:hypothetical protein
MFRRYDRACSFRRRVVFCRSLIGMATVAAITTLCSAAEPQAVDPVSFGAKPDGKTLCTAAIQKAIDQCAAGGGVVTLRGGTFLSGTIYLKSNVALQIDEGATLLGSADVADYPATISGCRSYTDLYTNRSLIYGENLTNVAIQGKGTIDGQGSRFLAQTDDKKRPYLIRMITCKKIRIEGVALRNSAMWLQHYLACDDLVVRNLRIWNHANRNNDMIDIDGCHGVRVDGCTSDSDDDGLTLKSTLNRACEDVVVTNCTISSHCNAIKCGTETHGGFKRISISNCKVKPSAVAKPIFGLPQGLAAIALEIVDGGVMDDVSVSDIRIDGSQSPLFIRLGDRGRLYKAGIPRPGVGSLRNVTISNVTAINVSALGSAIAGITDHAIENLTLRNIHISTAGGGRKGDVRQSFEEHRGDYPECAMFGPRLPAYGLFFWHVKGLMLQDVVINAVKPDERPPIVLRDVEGVRLAGKNSPIQSRAPSASAATSIVVDCGTYPSAEAAGHSEAKVNWLDADFRDDTVCTQSFAALELQHYLRKMTGRNDDFVIVEDKHSVQGELILVGLPASNAPTAKISAALGATRDSIAALGAEGYCIKTGSVDGRRVTLIAGGGRVGTLYGVYDLLHRMGCRWFNPEAFGEEVPHAAWDPHFDVTEKPSFSVRGFYVYEKRGSPEFIQWMARNRLNLWGVYMDNQPLLHKLGLKPECGSHDAQWLFIKPEKEYPYDHPRFPKPGREKDPYPVSSQFLGDANKDGTLSYFEAHPEWYPMQGGKRIPGIEHWGGANLCTSNADACNEFTKNFTQAITDGIYAGASVVEMWMLDQGKWCECPQCKALGTPTDRNLLIVYRLDQEIKRAQRSGKLHRPIDIRFLAYADLIDPPTRPLPKDFDYQTCTATFFPIARCYVHHFDDPTCAMNAPFNRQLSGWIVAPQRFYRGQMCIGEYYNVSRFKSVPVCFMHGMAHDIPYYYQIGARQFHYMHVTTARWGTKSLTNYQMARQLWNVQTDCEPLWADYFARRYGPAASVMRNLYDSLETMLCNVEALKGWGSQFLGALDEGKQPLFPNSHLQYRREPGVKCDGPTLVEMVAASQKCRSLITAALAIPSPDRIKARLAEDERTFTYAEQMLRYYDQCTQAYQLARAGRKDEAREHFEDAKRVAELLRQDTWSMGLSFIHDEPFELNGFNATHATRALDHLAKLLGGSQDKPAVKASP